jgi:hypothetical protein
MMMFHQLKLRADNQSKGIKNGFDSLFVDNDTASTCSSSPSCLIIPFVPWLTRYQEYKTSYITTQKRAYFDLHKNEDWYAENIFLFQALIVTH